MTKAVLMVSAALIAFLTGLPAAIAGNGVEREVIGANHLSAQLPVEVLERLSSEVQKVCPVLSEVEGQILISKVDVRFEEVDQGVRDVVYRVSLKVSDDLGLTAASPMRLTLKRSAGSNPDIDWIELLSAEAPEFCL